MSADLYFDGACFYFCRQVKKGAAEVKDPAAEMAELDSMASCPEGVDAATWNLVVAARRRKMESEKTVWTTLFFIQCCNILSRPGTRDSRMYIDFCCNVTIKFLPFFKNAPKQFDYPCSVECDYLYTSK